MVTNRDIVKMASEAIAFRLAGDTDEAKSDHLRADLLRRVAGVSVEQLADVGRELLPRLVDRVRPESKDLIHVHHDARRDTWIVSASPQEIVGPLAEALGMTGAIGTRGKIVEGRYTDQIEGPFVYGAGKVAAIVALCEERGYDVTHCYSYSDSISDLPMLELVGHPVAVNPDRDLGEIARNRGWPVVVFARRTKQAAAIAAGTTLVVATAIASYALGRHHGGRAR